MIINLPCGCPTIPINKFINVKERLLAGETIIIDDPQIDESEITFFQLKDGSVFSLVVFPDDTQGTANFKMKRAIEICKEFWDEGYDFCSGDHMSFVVKEDEKDGEEIEKEKDEK